MVYKSLFIVDLKHMQNINEFRDGRPAFIPVYKIWSV